MVNDLERHLRFMLVASMGQNRPGVSCRQVEEALVRRANVPYDVFSVHKYKPEDFLLVFVMAELRDHVAAQPSLASGQSMLFFRRWTRLAQAQRVTAGSRVHLAIEGIPPHT
jgi:hypothetical protein